MKKILSLLIGAIGSSLIAIGTYADFDSTGGWTSAAPRDEIRPTFHFKKDGGPRHAGSLIIRADDRDGLDGHWAKSFAIKGGEYYRFHALRHVENVTTPRRSTLVRILWRGDQGRPVRHDALGAQSYAPNEPP